MLACSKPPAVQGSDPPLVKASNEVTFKTTQDLGSYHQHATITRTTTSADGKVSTTAQSLDLAFKDLDDWHAVEERDGRLTSEVLVADGIAWARSGPKLTRRGDAESYRVQLGTTWDPWPTALESLEGDVKLVPEALEEVEGRRAWRHRAELVPPVEGRHRVWTPTLVEGNVWIDEATALRLVGELHLQADGSTRKLDVALKFSTSGIGMDPHVPAPPDAP